MASSDELLIATAEADLEHGLAHLRAHVRALHGPLAGGAIEALILGGVAALHVRARIRHDVRELIDIAQRVAKGEDARALAQTHLDRVLRLKSKMHLVAREDDPQFQVIRGMALELFVRRLPDLARLASVPDAVDYPDLVRKAFPDRREVDALVEDNAASVVAILEHLEKHPRVLRVPVQLSPKLAATARDMVTWKLNEVKRTVDLIYAPPPARRRADDASS